MSNFLDEQDLKELFSGTQTPPPAAPIPPPPTPIPEEKPKVPEKVYAPDKFTWHTAVKFFGLFVIIFIVSYLMVNYSAVTKKTRWAIDVNILKKSYSKTVPSPAPNQFNPASQARLIVPKIGVDTLIIWNVEDEQIKDKLLEGIVHSKDTALPGQMGNVFLTGHSSYYAWVNSNYKSVFALLDKLETDDKIYIQYSSSVFTYVVYEKKVVKPTDTSVMDQGYDYNLTLMTCVPIGTNLNRLIIKAKQINLSSSLSG
ncbi:MAG: putative sortase [Candidatus Berkelbacteria bacterium]|nr:putative sortase [Candidatus Berkelbacteria bacterium]